MFIGFDRLSYLFLCFLIVLILGRGEDGFQFVIFLLAELAKLSGLFESSVI